jgi:ABC-2 type transport system ATP-binding protein
MIEVSGLTKYYGETRAIADLTFSIEKGQVVGFLGLNGAGKSTALKILAGYLLPTSGSVRIEGVDAIAEPEALRARIGFLPERPALYDEMTVSDFLSYLGRLRGLSTTSLATRLPLVIERTALGGKEKQVIGTLSLGFRKRLGIAQAIIHDPALVILDEPIGGLDPQQIREMRGLIRELGQDHTVLISSHILPEVEETCDQLLVLRDGELVVKGTEEELLERVGRGFDLEVTIRGPASGASALFDDLAAVSAAELADSDGDVHTFRLRLADGDVEGVAMAVVGAGLGLRRIAEPGGELEEAFLAIIGSQGART